MKNDKIQELSYKHWALCFCGIALLAFVCIPSWTRQREEDRVLNAKRYAEVLGYQVFEIYGEAARNDTTSKPSNSRAPASVQPALGTGAGLRESGSIGNDPWGQPYRYKILSAAKDVLKVQIWSAGPNKKFETQDEPGLAADTYQGDDVGIVLSMNHKPSE